MSTGMAWTPEMDARLRELHGAGMTAREIAERIDGVSRNAVIGRANRLGLKSKAKSALARQAKQAERAARAEVLATLPPMLAAAARSSDAAVIATAALKPTHCRFPIGDPTEPGFRYCCALKPLGRPYCEGHSVIARSAVQPEWPKKRRRAA